MIKQEIVEKISKYFKLTSFEAEKIYDDIFSGIIEGVKHENIADVTNLGEFIIKYNSGDENNKKTVEFLPTLSLEEEVNQRAFEESIQFQPKKYEMPESLEKPVEEKKTELNTMPEAFENNLENSIENQGNVKLDNEPEQNIPLINPVELNPADLPDEKILADEHLTVEEEIKRKRDEILNKITKPADELKETKISENTDKVTEVFTAPLIQTTQDKTEDFTVFTDEKTEKITESIDILTDKEEIIKSTEEITDKTEEQITQQIEDKKEDVQMSEKSFNDLFTEVKETENTFTENTFNSTIIPPPPPVVESTVLPPVENVIPPSAVELHNQITGDNNNNSEYQTTITGVPPVNGNGNGNGYEHKLQDNSYYIWYKDSEPNSSDTQTMSYEYELLYQATKEAEYKSKLRIYVTTFIMFFSIVLILLIFSPVLYKYFFTPKDEPNTEEVTNETSQVEEPVNNNGNNQASVNSLDNQNQQNNSQPPADQNTQNTAPVTEQPKQEQNSQQNTTPPVTEQPKQEQPKQEQPKQEQPKQETPKQNEVAGSQNIPGVQKSTMGWIDDYNKVIYVQLDNGKFTIQESAWDSDAKANKRISSVGTLVPGLKGSVLKVDLGAKGTWFRARFGEFTTIEEAKQKAEELRTKEKNRLQALLLTFLLYT